jgi:hypothetical protein
MEKNKIKVKKHLNALFAFMARARRIQGGGLWAWLHVLPVKQTTRTSLMGQPAALDICALHVLMHPWKLAAKDPCA